MLDKNEWIVADWAKDYIGLSTDGKKYEITNAEGLAKAVPETIAPFQQKHVVGETQVEFSEVPVGAYVLQQVVIKSHILLWLQKHTTILQLICRQKM